MAGLVLVPMHQRGCITKKLAPTIPGAGCLLRRPALRSRLLARRSPHASAWLHYLKTKPSN